MFKIFTNINRKAFINAIIATFVVVLITFIGWFYKPAEF